MSVRIHISASGVIIYSQRKLGASVAGTYVDSPAKSKEMVLFFIVISYSGINFELARVMFA